MIIPVDDSVEAKDVIYRIGEDPEDPNRGPTLELGYRFKGRLSDGCFLYPEISLIILASLLVATEFNSTFSFLQTFFLQPWGCRTGEDDKMEENLIIDGQILNAVRRFQL